MENDLNIGAEDGRFEVTSSRLRISSIRASGALGLFEAISVVLKGVSGTMELLTLNCRPSQLSLMGGF